MSETCYICGRELPNRWAVAKREAIDGVESAQVSHESGTAVVTMTKPVPDDVLIKAVTDAGYTVV